MSSSKLLLTAMLVGSLTLLSFLASAQVPDFTGEAAANWHTYNENLGQLTYANGDEVPNVKYYTEGTFPRIFCWEQEPSRTKESMPLITFSWTEFGDSVGDTSTLYRIDFSVKGEEAKSPAPIAMELADGHLNYYLPQTGPNGVTGVERFQRIKYPDIYPEIDLELYSNEVGFKAYFVVHPGGDPNLITGHFEGQDSIANDTFGIRAHLGQKKIRLTHAFAYQVQGGGGVSPVGWIPTLNNVGNGDVKFLNVGNYDLNKTLVFQLGGGMALGATTLNAPEWATYYGQDGMDYANDVKTASDGKIFMAGQSASSGLPNQLGEVDEPTTGFGDGYVTCFDADYKIEWVTTIGGFDEDRLEDIVLSSVNDNLSVFGVGSTRGSGLPVGAGVYSQGYFEGGSGNISIKAMLTALRASDGLMQYLSYFGGENTEGYAIAADSDGNIYIAGGTKNTDINENAQCIFDGQNPDRFTVCDPFGTAYYQNFNGYDNTPSGEFGSLWDGFITKFNVNSFFMESSTLLGGFRDEVITDIYIDQSTDELYFVGRTKTEYAGDLNNTCNVPGNGDFPLCDAGGNAFWQASINGASTPGGTWDAFTGKLSANGDLEWNSYLGGNDKDGASGVFVNTNGDIYITGWTATKQTIQIPEGSSSYSQFPVLYSGSEFGQTFAGGDFDAFIWKFNSSFEPQWGSLIGGDGDEIEYDAGGGFSSEKIKDEPNITISSSNLVLVSGFTTDPNPSSSNDFPFIFQSGLYNQYGNQDAFLPDYGISDAFLVGIDGNNEAMWSTYFGGSGHGSNTIGHDNIGDAGNGIAVSGNKVFVVGRTYSTDDFPHACPPGAYCNNNPSGVVNQDHSTAYIAQVNEKLWILTDGSDQFEENEATSVYPNPFSERVYFQVDNEAGQLAFTLMDITGKIVSSGTVRNGLGVDFSHLNTGIYLLRIDTEQPHTFRVVKQ